MDKRETLIKTILDRTSQGHVQWREVSRIPLVLTGTDGPLVYELRKAPMVGGRRILAQIPSMMLMVRDTATGDSAEVDDAHDRDVTGLLLALSAAASDAAAGPNEDDETISRLLSKIES